MGLHTANSDVGLGTSRSLTFSCTSSASPSISLWFFFIKNQFLALPVSSLSLTGVCFGKQSLNTVLSPRDTNSGSASLENPRGEHAGTGYPCRGEAPCLSLEPTAMQEFSFPGVFDCVLGCASKPLPTHLYANESSHMLGMFCP